MTLRAVRRVVLLLVLVVSCGRSGVYRYDLPPDENMSMEDAGVDAGVRDAGPVPCMPGHITLNKATPVVLLVLDRSSSMSTRFDNTTRWKALTESLASALPPVDRKMQLGALIFPISSGV